jgi:hypothetical protein
MPNSHRFGTRLARRCVEDDLENQTALGAPVRHFRENNGSMEIVRVVRGDLEFPFL